MVFGSKPTSELERDIAAHKKAIENPPFDVRLPDPMQPVDLGAMGFGRITDGDREFFAKTGSLGQLLNRLMVHSSWGVVESDRALAERWAGHIGKGNVGRHFNLYFNGFRTGALVMGADVNLDGVLEDVRLSLTFKYPFLYRYDDIYEMLGLLVVQIGDDTADDIRNRDVEVTQALLRTLWNMRHDEAHWFTFTQAGPATKMFGNLK